MLHFIPLMDSFPSSHVCFYSTLSITDANEEPITTKRNYVNFSNLFVPSSRSLHRKKTRWSWISWSPVNTVINGLQKRNKTPLFITGEMSLNAEFALHNEIKQKLPFSHISCYFTLCAVTSSGLTCIVKLA